MEWTIIAVVLLFGVFVACLLLPALGAARVGARRARCLFHVKQIGLSLKQYALDYDETFPWVESEPDRYYRLLGKLHLNYESDIQVFLCPSSSDEVMLTRNRGKAGDLFKESECRRGLSYAYGHKPGGPWTEDDPSTTRIAADKYTTQDYTENLFPKRRPANHWKGKLKRVEIGRNVVCIDGSGKWNNNEGPLEADPDWDITWYNDENGSDTETEDHTEPESDPEHDQTGPDWWSDPPDK